MKPWSSSRTTARAVRVAADVGRCQTGDAVAGVEVDRVDDASEVQARVRRPAIEDDRQAQRLGPGVAAGIGASGRARATESATGSGSASGRGVGEGDGVALSGLGRRGLGVLRRRGLGLGGRGRFGRGTGRGGRRRSISGERCARGGLGRRRSRDRLGRLCQRSGGRGDRIPGRVHQPEEEPVLIHRRSAGRRWPR